MALNKEVIFSIVNDLAKAFTDNSATSYIKMGRPGCVVGVPSVPTPICPKRSHVAILKILTDHLQVLQVITVHCNLPCALCSSHTFPHNMQLSF